LALAAILLFASVASSAPLKPAAEIALSKHGALASDVAWINDDALLVALIKGGVVRVTPSTKKVKVWLPEGPLPDGSPYAELVATDGETVVVTSGNRRHAVFRTMKGKHLFGFYDGPLMPLGLAVSNGKAFMSGWLTKVGTDADQQRGALFVHTPPDEMPHPPLHRIQTEDGLKRWRRTAPPYGGSVVAMPDGSVALITSAEPGVYRYDRDGKLAEVLGSTVDSLLVDSVSLGQSYAQDVAGRYTQFLNRQPIIDDLVATPSGPAILVRIASGDHIGWELWTVNQTEVTSRQPLEPKRLGPFGHMRCEARGRRLACAVNLPDAEDARVPKTSGSNPRLLLYQLAR
jgi:hypothetical protein